MKLRLAVIALTPLALAACDDLTTMLGDKPEAEVQPEKPAGPPQPPAVSPLQQPIEIAGGAQTAAPTAESRTLNTQAFAARGNEPFWAVDVAGNTALYKTPENQSGRKVQVNRLTFAAGVEYVGVLGGQAFALTIRGGECADTMSGEKFPMTATLKVGGRTNTGCAAPAAPAAAPAAPAS